jgi:toxin HigB-1
LKGSRAGIYAIAVSGNWRLTFWIKDNEIFDLELEDYH